MIDVPVPPVEVPYDEIDAGILPVVRALNDAGFWTIESCQGHGTEDAYVVVVPTEGGPGATAARLRDELVRQRWHENAILSVEWSLDDPTGKRAWVRVRWWGAVPYR